ncbi:MAG: RNA polymerase sigma factor [Saprospiraceae bacterium]
MQELFRECYPAVCRAMYRIVREQATVEDLAQNVFIRFWEKRHSINITSSVGAYLNRMGVNEALAYLRKNKRYEIEELTPQTRIANDTVVSSEQTYLQTELKEQVKQAIDKLPPRCRLVFQLSRYEELTYKEIAAKLEISVKTVENQMGKALKVLRAELKGYLS